MQRRAAPRFAAVLACAVLGLLRTTPANALGWPDAAAKIEVQLESRDVAERRTAAAALEAFGAAAPRELVRRALEDSDAGVRLAALSAAVARADISLTEATLSWYGDADARIRAGACQIARAAPSPLAIPLLARTLSDADPAVRAAAAAALGNSRSPDAVTPLLTKLEDNLPAVRIAVIRALGRAGDTRATLALLGKVQDGNPEVRREAARSLALLADPRATAALAGLLRDTVTEVRVAAAIALGNARGEDAVRALEPLLLERPNAVRSAAIESLGRLGTESAQRALLPFLGTGEDLQSGFELNPLRSALLAARPDTLAAALRTILASNEGPARVSAAAVLLGSLGDASDDTRIIAAMRRGTLPVDSALHALSGLSSPRALPIALEQLGATSARVRREARLLAQISLHPDSPDGRAVDPIAAALADRAVSDADSAELLDLLGRTGSARAADIVAPFADNPREPVRVAAVMALGHLATHPASADALLGVLTKSDARLRLLAADGLARSNSPRVFEALVRSLNGDTAVDRLAHLHALAGVSATQPGARAERELLAMLDVATAQERDVLLEALARAGIALRRSAYSTEDWLAYVRALAPRGAMPAQRAAVLPLLRAATTEPNAAVRAEATFGLGRAALTDDLPLVLKLTQATDDATSANAVLAYAQIARRSAATAEAVNAPQKDALCTLLVHPNPWARVNALRGLAVLHHRCGTGERERNALLNTEAHVRAAAADLLHAAPLGSADLGALEACKLTDPSQAVSEACARDPQLIQRSRSTLLGQAFSGGVLTLYLPTSSGENTPHAPFALELAGGFVRRGETDRRGVTVDVAPAPGSMRRVSLQFTHFSAEAP